MAIEVNFVKLPYLFEARQGDSRQSKKKRQSCRLVPLKAEGERRSQGGARTRDRAQKTGTAANRDLGAEFNLDY